MMLAHGNMRVSHLTTHIALEDVPKRVTPERLRRVIELTHDALTRLGIGRARIAVAALNPHAGEGGLFGRHDIDVAAPDDRRGGRGRPRRGRPGARRHRIRQAARRPVRRRDRHVPRPGAHPGQAAGLRRRSRDRQVGRRSPASTSRSACRSSAPRSITAPPSTSPARGIANEQSLSRRSNTPNGSPPPSNRAHAA